MECSDFFKLLIDRKVADSIQFFTSCQYKLKMAELNCNALKILTKKSQEEKCTAINKVFEDAKKQEKEFIYQIKTLSIFSELKLT